MVSRDWPIWARYVTTTAFVVLVAMAPNAWPEAGMHIFWLFLTVIILSAMLFDYSTSFYATASSVAVLAVFFWRNTYALASSIGWLELLLFALTALAVSGLVETLHITVLKLRHANLALAASEQEKDLLLRESSHRFANDLTQLTALIALEQRTAGDDPRIVELLRRISDRVGVFARLQNRLLRRNQNAMVQIRDYIEDLCQDVHSSLAGVRAISIEAHSDPQPVLQSDAVLIGLITNELVTNALKHAFPGDRAGRVKVSFECNDEFLLSVEDDGVGGVCADPFEPTRNRGHLGQGLVNLLARQLRGTYEIHPRKDGTGTIARVRFQGSDSRCDESGLIAASRATENRQNIGTTGPRQQLS